MSKRFTIKGKEIIQNKQVWCVANSEHCADVIATAMNEFYEENTMLKERRHEDINDLSVIAMKYKALEKENEQLKTIISQLRTDNTKQKKKLNTAMKENEQLKQQIHYLKIVCRNELDDETLKQVMGSLGDME